MSDAGNNEIPNGVKKDASSETAGGGGSQQIEVVGTGKCVYLNTGEPTSTDSKSERSK